MKWACADGRIRITDGIFPWGKEDKELFEFHKEMIRIHKDYDVLRTGALIYLISEAGMIGYGRFTANECVCVLVQTTEQKRQSACRYGG